MKDIKNFGVTSTSVIKSFQDLISRPYGQILSIYADKIWVR